MKHRRMRVAVVLLACIGLAAALATSCGHRRGNPALPSGNLAGKRVVMIVAHRDFRDEELFEPKKVFEAHGAMVVVASSTPEEARGMLGGSVKPDLLLKDVRAADYDAVVFVGGEGAKEYWGDQEAHRIAREALEQGKVLGAICLAPVTLARAWVLAGRRATVYPSEAAEIKAGGAEYTDARVEVDRSVVTASGPEDAREFAEAIVTLMAQ